MSEKKGQPGMIDAADRVMQELLDTPKVKEGFKVVISSVDPEAAPGLVRTLMWKDAELFLDVIGSVPDILNAFILGVRELFLQAGNFPSAVLADFVVQIMENLDGESLGSAINEASGLYSRVRDVEGEPVQEGFAELKSRVTQGMQKGEEEVTAPAISILQPFLRKQIRHLAAEAGKKGSETQKAVNELSRTLAEELKENPDFVTYVIKPFLETMQNALGDHGK